MGELPWQRGKMWNSPHFENQKTIFFHAHLPARDESLSNQPLHSTLHASIHQWSREPGIDVVANSGRVVSFPSMWGSYELRCMGRGAIEGQCKKSKMTWVSF